MPETPTPTVFVLRQLSVADTEDRDNLIAFTLEPGGVFATLKAAQAAAQNFIKEFWAECEGDGEVEGEPPVLNWATETRSENGSIRHVAEALDEFFTITEVPLEKEED